MALHRQMYETASRDALRDLLEDALRDVLGDTLEVNDRDLGRRMASDSVRCAAENLDRHADRCM